MIALNNPTDTAICTHGLVFFKGKKIHINTVPLFRLLRTVMSALLLLSQKTVRLASKFDQHELYRPGIYSTAGENGKLFTFAKN